MVIKRLKNNKKGEFMLRTWVVSILIFTAIFTLLFLSSNDLIDEHGESNIIDNKYRSNYDKFSEISGDYETKFEDISEGTESNWGVIETGLEAMTVLVDVVRITFASVNVFDDIMVSAIDDFGIPREIAIVFIALISSIIAVLLIFVVISSVNRGSKI